MAEGPRAELFCSPLLRGLGAAQGEIFLRPSTPGRGCRGPGDRGSQCRPAAALRVPSTQHGGEQRDHMRGVTPELWPPQVPLSTLHVPWPHLLVTRLTPPPPCCVVQAPKAAASNSSRGLTGRGSCQLLEPSIPCAHPTLMSSLSCTSALSFSPEDLAYPSVKKDLIK